ncbi:MAG TPA: acetyl-CoA carboxylase biotin carboxyl carrier protein subunit [Bacteroidetes bacterium]|nr:acetyl-CoA carboxylase biotin carboxyl carrier protein subunit [Bacteroidota bacterium]
MNMMNIEKLIAVSSSGKDFEFEMPLKDKIVIQGEEYDIKLYYTEESGLYLVWNGKKYPVEIVKSKQNKYEILFNSISYSFTIETPFSLQRMKVLKVNKPSVGNISVKAPMPGKIVDIICQKGSKVSRGEPLLILEAMKMENEILSPIDGTVLSVSVSKDSTVMKDDILVEIEEKKG